MSIKIRDAVWESLSRAVFCLLILLPMGAVMAASKSAPKPNPLLQNPAQPSQASPYTAQNGAVTQSVAVAAVQSVGDTTSAGTDNRPNNVPPLGGTPQKAGSGGGL